MSDIFLCYSRADSQVATQLEKQLKAEGWTVFRDVQTHVGRRWDNEIESELHSARAVVVLWSEKSRNSEYVLEEAEYGKRKAILFPARIEQTEPPYGFGRIQTADLTGWANENEHPALVQLLGSLKKQLNGSSPHPHPHPPEITTFNNKRLWILVGPAILIVTISIQEIMSQPESHKSTYPAELSRQGPISTTTGGFDRINKSNSGFATARFICYNGVTVPGQSVYVVGNIPELGNWDPGKAVKLDVTDKYWTRTITNLPPSTRIEWKCIKRPDSAASPVVWQDATNSSIFTSPPAGEIADKAWESHSLKW